MEPQTNLVMPPPQPPNAVAVMSPPSPNPEEFLSEVDGRIRLNRRLFVLNCCLGLFFLSAAALSSFVATVLVATETGSQILRATFAGLPTFLLGLYASVGFHDRSNYHARLRIRFSAIRRAVCNEGLPIAEASRMMSVTEEIGFQDMLRITPPNRAEQREQDGQQVESNAKVAAGTRNDRY